jgi:hypothetical protein
MGASLLLLPMIDLIPIPVTNGLFLYMGLTSLTGNQFVERVKLWLCDPDLYPDADFIHTVPRGKLHAFTMLQVVCLMSLWTLRTSHWGMHSYPSSIVSSLSKFCLTIFFFFSSILFILSVISSSTVKPTISDMLVSDCCINLLTGLIVST